jgi:hypothetical protein
VLNKDSRTMNQDTLFARILAEDNRPNPFPLYAIMRNTPIARQVDGTYVVSSYDAIYRLLYDPRLSSEDLPPPSVHWTGNPIKNLIVGEHEAVDVLDRMATVAKCRICLPERADWLPGDFLGHPTISGPVANDP